MIWWQKRKLRSSDPATRVEAAKRLGASGSTAALVPLLAALEDTEFNVRSAALDALKQLSRKEAVPGLIGALSGRMGYFVLDALEKIDPDWAGHPAAPQAVSSLFEFLKEVTSMDLPEKAASALDRLQPGWRSSAPGRTVRQRYAELLSSEHWYERFFAVRVLGAQWGHEAVPYLQRALRDEDSRVRDRAVEALQKMGWEPSDLETRIRFHLVCGNTEAAADASAVPVLLEVLAEEDASLRDRAVKALGRAAGRGAIAPLLELMLDGREVVRQAAEQVLGRIDANWPQSDEARARVSVLAAEMRQASGEGRLAAIRLLGRIGGSEAAAHLKEAVGSAAWIVEWRAAAEAARSLDPAWKPPRGEEEHFAPAPCSSCGRTLDPRRVRAGGGEAKILLTAEPGPLRCGACGALLCTACASDDPKAAVQTISLECRACGGRLQVFAGAPPDAVFEEDAYDHLEDARDLVGEGRLREAVHAYSLALSIKRDLYEAYYERGKCRAALGDRHGMVTDFRKALELSPTDWGLRDEVEAYVNPRGRRR